MAVGSGLVILASDVAEALNAWQSFTPTLYTLTTGTRASIAKTVTRAVYVKRNGLCIAQVDLTANAGSASGASVSLPVPAIARQVVCGSAAIMGASAPTQAGVAQMTAALDSVGVVNLANAFQDIVSGQTLRYSVAYQCA